MPSPDDTNVVRGLETRADALRDEIAELRSASEEAGRHCPRDAADLASTRRTLAELGQRMTMRSRELAEVSAAIGRARQGTLGRCVDCGEAIAPARLQALPAAARCRECAQPMV